MKILIWNIWGAAKPSFYSTFRIKMQLYNPDICILLETHRLGLSLDHGKRCFQLLRVLCYCVSRFGQGHIVV